jgi:hypothetical protein
MICTDGIMKLIVDLFELRSLKPGSAQYKWSSLYPAWSSLFSSEWLGTSSLRPRSPSSSLQNDRNEWVPLLVHGEVELRVRCELGVRWRICACDPRSRIQSGVESLPQFMFWASPEVPSVPRLSHCYDQTWIVADLSWIYMVPLYVMSASGVGLVYCSARFDELSSKEGNSKLLLRCDILNSHLSNVDLVWFRSAERILQPSSSLVAKDQIPS